MAASASRAAGIEADLAGVDAALEIVDGEFQHPRRGQSHGRGGDDAEKSKKERPAIPEDVAQEPTTRGHS